MRNRILLHLIALFFLSTFLTTQSNLIYAQNCDCRDYIYVNDASNGLVHKFEIDPNDQTVLTEIGNPWFPAGTIVQPHGTALDLNGNYYVSQLDGGDPKIIKVDCAGQVLDDPFITNLAYTNSFTIGNTLYVTGGFSLAPDGSFLPLPGVLAYDLCTGNQIGSLCLNMGDQAWGLRLGADGCIYATTHWSGAPVDPLGVFKICDWTEQDLMNNTCYDAFIDEATITANSSIDGYVQGVDADEAGNIYFITNALNSDPNPNTCIQKYDAAGNFVAEYCDNDGSDGGIFTAVGFVYLNGLLYVGSPFQCVALIDPATMQPVPGGFALPGPTKAVGNARECCPTQANLVIDEVICTDEVGGSLFLQDLIGCGEGVICGGGDWVETANTSGGNITYEACSASITPIGEGCASYVLENTQPASELQRCDPFSITVNVCVEVCCPPENCINQFGEFTITKTRP